MLPQLGGSVDDECKSFSGKENEMPYRPTFENCKVPSLCERASWVGLVGKEEISGLLD